MLLHINAGWRGGGNAKWIISSTSPFQTEPLFCIFKAFYGNWRLRERDGNEKSDISGVVRSRWGVE